MDTYVKFYDFIVNHTNELVVLRKIAASFPKPPEILELGAGTGRLTIPLAESGFNIHAVDINEKMLEILQVKLNLAVEEIHKRIFLEKTDFVTAEFAENHYDVIFFSSNTFLLITDEDKLQKVLEKVFKALKINGFLYLEVFNPTSFFERISQRSLIHLYTRINPETNFETAHFVSYLHNPLEQILISYNFLEEFPLGAPSKRYSFKETVRYMNLPELRFRLKTAGFKQFDFYADYELKPVEISSLKIITLAKK